MSSAESDGSKPFARLIFDAQERVEESRTLFYEEQARGSISDKTRSHLQSAVLRYYCVLRRYRDEDSLSEEWHQRDFSVLEDLIDQTEEVRVEKAGRGKSTVTKRRPLRLEPRRAVRLSLSLDDVAHELGFTAQAEQTRPKAKAEVTDGNQYPDPVREDIPKPE